MMVAGRLTALPPMRFLALIPPGTNSRSIFADLLRGLQLAGHTVFFEDLSAFILEQQRMLRESGGRPTAAVQGMATTYARALENTFAARGCDAMITLWVDPLMALPFVKADPKGEHSASFTEVLGIPVIHYWLDAPFWAYEGRLLPHMDKDRFTSPLHIHVVNNPGTAEEMRRVLGFRSVIDLPYGVDEAVFRPWPVDRTHDLAINAGPGDEPPTEIMRAELARDVPDIEAIRRDQADRARPMLADMLKGIALSATGSNASALAAAWLDEQLTNPDRPMLEKLHAAAGRCDGAEPIVNALIAYPGSGKHWAIAGAIVRRVECWQRAFVAAHLSHRFKCLIIGHCGELWNRAGWDVRGDRIGPAPYHELGLHYSRCAAGLNVMRYQDDVGSNIKGLECAASGCVPLQRRRVGMDALLRPGAESLYFDSPVQARDRLSEILKTPEQRRQLAAAARAAVESRHTWKSRAAELVERATRSLSTR